MHNAHLSLKATLPNQGHLPETLPPLEAPPQWLVGRLTIWARRCTCLLEEGMGRHVAVAEAMSVG